MPDISWVDGGFAQRCWNICWMNAWKERFETHGYFGWCVVRERSRITLTCTRFIAETIEARLQFSSIIKKMVVF